MQNVRDRDQRPQEPDQSKRHLATAAVVIAGLLAEHPTAMDAREAARSWLVRYQADEIVTQMENAATELAALAGGAL